MSNINKQALTDEAISKAFAGTNFGRDDFKNILAETVIDAAAGWRCGYTATTICTQLGLLTPKGCASALGLRFISEHVQRETKRLKDELEAAEKLISELEAESEERRQFILNGVEMGFIRLPDKDTRDPATATYERCLNGIQYMPCPKCNDTGMMDSGGTQPWGEPIEIECDCRHQDSNTAELVAAGIITKVGE